jgi:hypothetical protein
MHRMILGAEQGMVGDLRDKDGLNNQVENLRVCDRSRNVMGAARYRLGASRYKGMDLHRGKWRARICAYGQRLNLEDCHCFRPCHCFGLGRIPYRMVGRPIHSNTGAAISSFHQ